MDYKCKQSLYFPEDMLHDIKAEALRQDRSMSWLVQRAWIIAREKIGKLPNTDGSIPDGEQHTGDTG